MFRILFCLTLAATFLNACTIEKRTFRKGWHVEWKQHHESVADRAEKQAQEQVERERVVAEPVSETFVAETAATENAVRPLEDAAEQVVSTEANEKKLLQHVEDPVVSRNKSPLSRVLPLNLSPKGDVDAAAPANQGLWWIVALLVGITLAAAIWLAVGTGGSAGLLVALFVALVGSVAGAIALSMHIKKTTPKEEEVDIQFDDLTENEIQRKKKLKGLIAALILVIVGTTIILVGSK